MKDVRMVLTTTWYVNRYRCEDCNVEWDDEWDCGCNDECPECGAETEPYFSHDISEK